MCLWVLAWAGWGVVASCGSLWYGDDPHVSIHRDTCKQTEACRESRAPAGEGGRGLEGNHGHWVKNESIGVEAMFQQLRALVALSEDWSSVPGTHVGQLSTACNSTGLTSTCVCVRMHAHAHTHARTRTHTRSHARTRTHTHKYIFFF